MKQVKPTKNNLALVGEEISHELGAKMVKDFQDACPNEATANYIGKVIIEKILAQPGCMGIRFYNAINESGKKTLVYVGVDVQEDLITNFVGVNADGELVNVEAIVGDRAGGENTGWEWWTNDPSN